MRSRLIISYHKILLETSSFTAGQFKHVEYLFAETGKSPVTGCCAYVQVFAKTAEKYIIIVNEISNIALTRIIPHKNLLYSGIPPCGKGRIYTNKFVCIR